MNAAGAMREGAGPAPPHAAAPMGSALLVHGAGGGAWEWRRWTPRLRGAGFAVHELDLRAAAGGRGATLLQDYCDQVAEALRRARHPRLLVGASLGGLLALMAAPGSAADGMVLVNPVPPAPWHRQLPPREHAGAIVPWGLRAQLEGTRRSMPGSDPASSLHAFRRWRDESAEALRQAWAGIEVQSPGCPVLVLCSEADEDVPARAPAAMAAAMGFDYLGMPRTGHVDPLLGDPARSAVQAAVRWVNTIPAFRAI
jgi:alpha-beta hydrolase superfamily lysophospholipase